MDPVRNLFGQVWDLARTYVRAAQQKLLWHLAFRERREGAHGYRGGADDGGAGGAKLAG